MLVCRLDGVHKLSPNLDPCTAGEEFPVYLVLNLLSRLCEELNSVPGMTFTAKTMFPIFLGQHTRRNNRPLDA